MTNKLITVRNTLNGQVTQVRPAIMRNPHLAKHLVIVDDNAKPQIFIKPTTSEEYVSRRRTELETDLTPEDNDLTEEG